MRTQQLVKAKGTDADTSERRKLARAQVENELYSSTTVRVRRTTRGTRLEVRSVPPAQGSGDPVWLP